MSKKWIIPMVAALVLVPTGTSIYYGVQYNNLQHSEQVESNSGLVKTIEELRQSVASLTTEREKLNADLNKITAENEANKALVADLKVQVTNLTAVKTEYEATHAEDTATIASLNSQIDTLNARITTYEATIAENEATIESLTIQKTQLTTQVNSLTARVNTLTEENSTWETNYNNLSLEYDLLSDRFDSLTETSHALQTEIARLNGALTSAQNTDTALVNSLLKDVFADTIIKDTFSDDSCMAGMKYLQTETLLLVYTPSTEIYSILYTSTEAETNIASVAWSENKAVITLANSNTLEVVVPGATTPQASVTFYNGETAVSVVSLDKGTKVSDSEIPTIDNISEDILFAGWSLTSDATNLIDLSLLDINEDITLYARFKQKTWQQISTTESKISNLNSSLHSFNISVDGLLSTDTFRISSDKFAIYDGVDSACEEWYFVGYGQGYSGGDFGYEKDSIPFTFANSQEFTFVSKISSDYVGDVNHHVSLVCEEDGVLKISFFSDIDDDVYISSFDVSSVEVYRYSLLQDIPASKVSVTFKNTDDTTMTVTEVDAGSKLSASNIPYYGYETEEERVVYTLTADGTEIVDLSTLEITENLTLYVRFQNLVTLNGGQDVCFEGINLASSDYKTIDLNGIKSNSEIYFTIHYVVYDEDGNGYDYADEGTFPAELKGTSDTFAWKSGSLKFHCDTDNTLTMSYERGQDDSTTGFVVGAVYGIVQQWQFVSD